MINLRVITRKRDSCIRNTFFGLVHRGDEEKKKVKLCLLSLSCGLVSFDFGAAAV